MLGYLLLAIDLLDSYVDFAIWLPFGKRAGEATNNASTDKKADGSEQTFKIKAPQNLKAWILSFDVWATAMMQWDQLGTGDRDGDRQGRKPQSWPTSFRIIGISFTRLTSISEKKF